jgi:predicted amidohydrolase
VQGSFLGRPNRSRARFERLNQLLNQVASTECDLFVLPEVSIPHAWLPWLTWFASQRQVGLVAGLEHEVRSQTAYNFIATILPFKRRGKFNCCHVWRRLKRHYAPAETKELLGHRLKVPDLSSSQPYDLFRWRGANFAVYNCYELANIEERCLFKGRVDFLVSSEFNRDTNYFSSIVEASARDLHCYVVQANDSFYGDSRIVSPRRTEEMNVIQIKGGENDTFVKASLDLKGLREHQLLTHSLQMEPHRNFKPTPPGWDYSLVEERVRNASRRQNR